MAENEPQDRARGSVDVAKNIQAIRGLKKGAKRYNRRVRGERGLYVAVHPTGQKVYFVRFQIGHGLAREERSREIGNTEDISLADACARAAEVRSAVAQGGNPFSLKGQPFSVLFTRWLEEYAKLKKRSWAEDDRRWQLHIEPKLGHVPVNEITRARLIELLADVAKKGPVQANRVGALLSKIFNWALDTAVIEQTPANRLPKHGEERARERILGPTEIAKFWEGLERAPASESMRIALRLMLVTAQRRGEVMGARKQDIYLDEDAPTWTIPAPATKNKLMHRVPLAPLATRLFRDAIGLAAGSPYVFPSPDDPKTHMWETAATKAMGRFCEQMKMAPAYPHDLRRTAGTTLARLGVPHEIIMRVLNHVREAKRTTLAKHYDLHGYDAEKRAALEKWERELRRLIGEPSTSNIVTLRA